MEQLKALPLARYEFRLRANENALLPTFLGATLRGSFGHALKAIACSVEHQDCNRCLLTQACTYPQIFEPSALPYNETKKQQDPPRPFIFQPPLPRVADSTSTIENSKRAWSEKHIPVKAGESFSFGMTLYGTAIAKLPYIVYAVELMARHGLSVARTPFELEEVLIVNEQNESISIYTPADMSRITPHKAEIKTLSELVEHRLSQINMEDTLTLLFITPTWIEIKKEILESINCETFIKRLSWRMAQLFELYGNAPLAYDHKTLIEQSATIETTNENLWFHRFERFANRTQSKKPLQGFLGAITFRGRALKELLPLIIAGEFLQLGKETAFGLGRYWTLA